MNIRSIPPLDRTDESVFVFVRPYFLAFLPWFALGFFLILMGIIFSIFTFANFPNLVGSGIGYNVFVVMTSAYFLLLIPFLTVAFIDFYYDISIVTDRRLIDIDQNNLFSREINELALEEIQDVTTRNRGILSSVFDFGDVLIETAGPQERFEFDRVLHPREIASIILDLADQAKRSIEGGQDHLIPRGDVKGVIRNEVFDTLKPLVAMGAIVGHNPDVHPDTTPAHATTTETSAPLPLTKEESQSTAPTETVKTEEPAAAEDDLDIVIDDPKKK